MFFLVISNKKVYKPLNLATKQIIECYFHEHYFTFHHLPQIHDHNPFPFHQDDHASLFFSHTSPLPSCTPVPNPGSPSPNSQSQTSSSTSIPAIPLGDPQEFSFLLLISKTMSLLYQTYSCM